MTTSNKQQSDLVRDRFTRTVEAFGDYAVTYREKFAEELARLVGARPTDRVADLACGPGTLALRFAERVRWVCAVDLTPAMLLRARRTAAEEGRSNLGFVLADAQELPFPEGSLDIAVTSYSLHHIPDSARVVREMARAVKPGGRVGIIDILVPEDPKAAEAANRIERMRDPSHTRSLARSDFEKMLRDAGLRMTSGEVQGNPRSFDHWMHVAGWHRGDPVYAETRRLMEATIADDLAGFHPQFSPPDAAKPGETPDIQMVNTAIFIAAEKG
ncbi:MAG: methyltransferase domain-containing protein [Candidatus Acidiferrales bacterium]